MLISTGKLAIKQIKGTCNSLSIHITLKSVCTSHRGLKLCFLSDFRPREEYYVLLNDESSTIKRF